MRGDPALCCAEQGGADKAANKQLRNGTHDDLG
jgi:hypothetical protein